VFFVKKKFFFFGGRGEGKLFDFQKRYFPSSITPDLCGAPLWGTHPANRIAVKLSKNLNFPAFFGPMKIRKKNMSKSE